MLTIHLRTLYTSTELLSELRTGEIFLVCSLRLWVLSHCSDPGAYPDWREGFQRAGIGCAGAIRFDNLCRIIATTAQRTLHVRSIYCARLGEDEALFLSLLGLLQHDRDLDAEAILRGWCPPAAVRVAMTPARGFAYDLRSRMLWVSAPHIETAPALTASTSMAGATLH